jgi:ABC-type bacteriocin/lantibiotic exporter with double-glycine peptidase domain
VTAASAQLLASPDFKDLFYIQRFITRAHMETIIDSLQSTVQTRVSSSQETRLALFTLFIVAILFLFVIVWIPFINGLSTEVHQTKRLLLLIPVELLMNLKNVATLLS